MNQFCFLYSSEIKGSVSDVRNGTSGDRIIAHASSYQRGKSSHMEFDSKMYIIRFN